MPLRSSLAALCAVFAIGASAAAESTLQQDRWYEVQSPALDLVPGDEFSVLEINGDFALIGLDNMESDPIVAWVELSQLEQTHPVLIDEEESADPKAMTYCLRDVRIAARKFTAAKNIPQGIPRAALAYPAYKAKGWRPIKLSASVTNGTACFYGGGRRDCKGWPCGHAAIKIGKNKWKGAGIRPVPGLPNKKGRTYVFHGCLTPP